jgi:uncharacterized protein (DUF302 family)
MEDDGIITLASPYSVAATAKRLETFLESKGMKIFASIHQAAEAEAVGLKLRPTVLILFGNPKAGTPLMEKFPSLALDLPLKVLAWQSPEGENFISFTSPAFLQDRHRLPEPPFEPIPKLMEEALK